MPAKVQNDTPGYPAPSFPCTTSRKGILSSNGPDTDKVVGEAPEQCLAVSRPCDRHTLGFPRVSANVYEFRLEFVDDRSRKAKFTPKNKLVKVNNALALKIKDFNTAGGGSAQPVTVGGENEGIDDITCLKGVEVLALIQVPKHGNTILATRCRQGTIGGDRNSINVAGMAVVICLQLEL